MRFKDWLENFKLPTNVLPKGPGMPSQFNSKPTTSAQTASDMFKKSVANDKTVSAEIASLPTKPNGQQNREISQMAGNIMKSAGTKAKQTTPQDVQNNIRATAMSGASQ
jgi:uncharacterized protein (DUF305 family)